MTDKENIKLPTSNTTDLHSSIDPCAPEAAALLNCAIAKDYRAENCLGLLEKLRACAKKHVRLLRPARLAWIFFTSRPHDMRFG